MKDLPLVVEAQPVPGGRVIKLTGSLTLGNISALQDVLRNETYKTTVLDMGAVPYADSTGIGLLVGAHINAQAAKTNLVLAAVSDRIRNALRTARVDHLFVMVPDVPAALANLGPWPCPRAGKLESAAWNPYN